MSGEFRVSGVIEDLPSNTHLEFDFLLPLEFMLSHYGIYTRSYGWDWYNFYTYITLFDDVDFRLVEEKFNPIIESNIGEELKTGLQALSDIHLSSDFKSDLAKSPGSIQNIFTLRNPDIRKMARKVSL